MSRLSVHRLPVARRPKQIRRGAVARPMFGPLEIQIEVVVTQVPKLVGTDSLSTTRADRQLARLDPASPLLLSHRSAYIARVALTYEWRGQFTNAEINALHAEAFQHGLLDDDWDRQLHRHSLGWVCARRDDELIGFVNLAWDGGVHAFILDTIVTIGARRQGVGSRLVAVAVEHARTSGCEWLHVDFDDHLRAFYLDACGFVSTNAGLIRLR